MTSRRACETEVCSAGLLLTLLCSYAQMGPRAAVHSDSMHSRNLRDSARLSIVQKALCI